MRAFLFATLVLAGCRSHHEDVTPSPPITADPCPLDFDLADADAWPRCSVLGPLGLERVYFQLGIHPCRISTGRIAFTLGWGPNGRLDREGATSGTATTYHYDATGHLVSADKIDGAQRENISYARDAQGRLTKADTGTRTTTYTRDDAGNIIAIDSSYRADRRHETLRYDGGLAVSAELTEDVSGTRSTTTTTVERDGRGRRTRSRHHTSSPDGAAMDTTIAFAYDASDHLSSLIWTTDSSGLGHDETVMRAVYDAKGRLATLDEGTGRILTYQYDCP